MPEVYAPPEAADAEPEPFATFCQVPVGPWTAFDGQSGLRVPEDFPRGIEWTVFVVEAPKAVCWTGPDDYVYWPDWGAGVVSRERKSFPFGPRHGQGFLVALGDGTVCFLTTHHKATFWEMIYRCKLEPADEPLNTNW
jgi:hypothetical protein